MKLLKKLLLLLHFGTIAIGIAIAKRPLWTIAIGIAIAKGPPQTIAIAIEPNFHYWSFNGNHKEVYLQQTMLKFIFPHRFPVDITFIATCTAG